MLAGLRIGYAVIGCSDVQATATFFGRLGFTDARPETVAAEEAAELYGVGRALALLEVGIPGSSSGRLRLVEAAGEPRPWAPYAVGRTLLEFFVRSVEEALPLALDAGARRSGATEFEGASRRNRESRVFGPDGVELGLTESTEPRISPGERPVGELATVAWFVASVPETRAAFPELDVHVDFARDEWPPASEFLGLPDAAPAVHTIELGDAEGRQRLQLLTFPGRMEAVVDKADRIRPGVYAVGFEAAVDVPVLRRRRGVCVEVRPPRRG